MARRRLKRPLRLFKGQTYHKSLSPRSSQSREQRRELSGRQKALKRRMWFGVILCGLAGAVYLFGFIRSVEVAGLEAGDAETVRQAADDYFKGSWYRRFKPLSNLDSLAGSIELQDSRFDGTTASVGWLSDSVTVSSRLRQPVASLKLSGDNSAYLLDNNGVIFIDSDSKVSALPKVIDTTELNFLPGQQYIGLDKLRFILLLDSQIEDKGLYPGKNWDFLIDDSPKEVQLSVPGVTYKVRFHTGRPASDQAAELEAALKHLKRVNRTPAKYIDLRVDDTAYYQ